MGKLLDLHSTNGSRLCDADMSGVYIINTMNNIEWCVLYQKRSLGCELDRTDEMDVPESRQ